MTTAARLPATRQSALGGPRRAGWPMYVADRPAVQAWWRGLSAGLRERGIDGVPDALDEPDGAAALDAHWCDPRLLLSQTCGYPLVTRLAGAVQVVGAFRWTAPGCDGIAYRSWLVARAVQPSTVVGPLPPVSPMLQPQPQPQPQPQLQPQPQPRLQPQPRPPIDGAPDRDEPAEPAEAAEAAEAAELAAALVADAAAAIEPFRGGVAAFNDAASHSGCNALRALVAPLAADSGAGRRFFSRAIETGSHRASLAAVRDGRADIAAIDCITWVGLRRCAPELLAGLRVVGSSAPAPGLPLITSTSTPPAELAALRGALAAVCADAALAAARRALFIGGFEPATAADWQAVDDTRRRAQPLGRDGW